MLTRRGAMIGGGLAAIAAGWQIWGVRPPSLDFRPISRAPGWSIAISGGFSGAIDPATVGLGTARAAHLQPLPADQLEEVLFGQTRQLGKVPMAVFSDHFCPYCRLLFARLVTRLGAHSGVTLAWHELPLLRPASHIAARAAEAANLQGGYVPFQQALIETGFRPSTRALGQIAGKAGLDGARLMQDMQGGVVAARLTASARAAETLGVFATPGLVVDKKVVLGAVARDQLDALIATARRNAA